MKKIFFFLLAFVSFRAMAQSDTINIRLPAWQHAYIIGFMPKDGSVLKTRYCTQVANALSLTSGGEVADSNQVVNVNTTFILVRDLFLVMGSQQERLTTTYNDVIKLALVPQILRKPALLNMIGLISAQNASETNQVIRAGFQYLKDLKL